MSKGVLGTEITRLQGGALILAVVGTFFLVFGVYAVLIQRAEVQDRWPRSWYWDQRRRALRTLARYYPWIGIGVLVVAAGLFLGDALT